jgi:tight adherence protein B
MTTVQPLIAAVVAGVLVVLLGARARRFTEAPPRQLDGAGAPRPRRRPPRPRPDRRRSHRVGDDDVAAWCDDAARRVRSGASLTTAVLDARSSGPLAAQLDPIRLAIDRGATLGDAVLRVAAPPGPLVLALAVVRACAELGGPAASPLDRVAATLRARAADAAERRAHSAQARLSALVLTAMPAGTLAVLVVVAAPIRAVMATPAGVGCGLAGSALNVVGWTWMRRITDGARA